MTRASRNESKIVSTTSVQVSPARSNRVAVFITNTSAAAKVYICKGDIAAVAGAGIKLEPNQVWYDSNSGEGATCWKGAIQVIADAAGTIAVNEDLELM